MNIWGLRQPAYLVAGAVLAHPPELRGSEGLARLPELAARVPHQQTVLGVWDLAQHRKQLVLRRVDLLLLLAVLLALRGLLLAGRVHDAQEQTVAVHGHS